MNLTRQSQNVPLKKRGARQPGFLCMLAVLAMARALFAAAPQTNAPAGTDYSSFRIIAERNIFDPNRYPHTIRSVHRTANTRTPAFSLVGTMTYKKGMLAFFDGTDSDYRKVLAPHGVINGYTVVEITLRGVKLESAGKAVEMKVGAQMRQEAKGEWHLAGPGELPAATVANEAPATGQTPAAGPAAGSDSEPNDVLKKLMQQREQEIK